MGDHDDAGIPFMGHFGKQFYHLATALTVERRRRFVGQYQARLPTSR
ncbi:MAG: hypothetical protein ACXV7J_12185 [Methylomonas sp.]